jgi:large subunit ribosomal protein L2
MVTPLFFFDRIPTLYRSVSKKFGRSRGAITVYHIKGGHRRNFRLIDLRRSLFNVLGKLVRVDFDPNRGAFLGLIYYYKVGIFSYILLPDGLKIGAHVKSAFKSSIFPLGWSFYIKEVPISTFIYNVELSANGGGKMARSAGTFVKIGRHFPSRKFVGIVLPSGKFIFVPGECLCSIGRVSNLFSSSVPLMKAGRGARIGYCPRVRGVAMNPIDHPHGGGEGKSSGGRISVSRWGYLTKGGRTRKRSKITHQVSIFKRINKLGY